MNVTSETIEAEIHFGAIDYSVFGIVLSGSMAIGIYFAFFSKSLKTADDYMVGGHKMKTFPVAISLMSSQLSAIAIITIPAEVYSFGWQHMLLILILPFVILLTNYISLPVFFTNNIENCYVYLEKRFGKTSRMILTKLFILNQCLFLPVMMYIPALAFAEVTQFNVHVINIVVSYICIIYTMLGGLKAVVYTDLLQSFVMIASITIVAILGINQTGGFTEVWDRAVEGGRIFQPIMSFDVTTRITFWNMIIKNFILWSCMISFSQNCAQRLISLPTLTSAKRTMVIFFIGVSFIMFINIGTGIIMYAYYHGCDPIKSKTVAKADNLVPHFVQSVASHIPGMSGIFISCVFSASLSHVSASIHSVAGLIYGDYVRPLKLYAHTDFNANLSIRIIIVLFGTVCAFGGLIVERFQSIYQIISTISGATVGAKFGVFTIGMLYPWANQKGVLSGVIISVATVTLIIINSRMHNLQYTPIPTSIDQCSNETLITHLNLDLIDDVSKTDGECNFPFCDTLKYAISWISSEQWTENNDEFAFYKISFAWYAAIGASLTWIFGIIVSYFTGGPDMDKFDINLFSPIIHQLLPAKYQQIELKSQHLTSVKQQQLEPLIEQNNVISIVTTSS